MTDQELIDELKVRSVTSLVNIADGFADAFIAERPEQDHTDLQTELGNIGVEVTAICNRKKSPH